MDRPLSGRLHKGPGLSERAVDTCEKVGFPVEEEKIVGLVMVITGEAGKAESALGKQEEEKGVLEERVTVLSRTP